MSKSKQSKRSGEEISRKCRLEVANLSVACPMFSFCDVSSYGMDTTSTTCWCLHVFGCGYAGRSVMRRFARRPDTQSGKRHDVRAH